MGVARGRWEGDTLVVESTNFSERSRFRNASAKARLVERFKPVAPDKIEWSLTVTDPETWTRPWTYGMQLTQDPDQTLFEYACHEGNYAMRNILSAGARGRRGAGEITPAVKSGTGDSGLGIRRIRSDPDPDPGSLPSSRRARRSQARLDRSDVRRRQAPVRRASPPDFVP